MLFQRLGLKLKRLNFGRRRQAPGGGSKHIIPVLLIIMLIAGFVAAVINFKPIVLQSAQSLVTDEISIIINDTVSDRCV